MRRGINSNKKFKFLIYSFQVFRHDLDLLKKLSEQGRLRYVLYISNNFNFHYEILTFVFGYHVNKIAVMS